MLEELALSGHPAEDVVNTLRASPEMLAQIGESRSRDAAAIRRWEGTTPMSERHAMQDRAYRRASPAPRRFETRFIGLGAIAGLCTIFLINVNRRWPRRPLGPLSKSLPWVSLLCLGRLDAVDLASACC